MSKFNARFFNLSSEIGTAAEYLYAEPDRKYIAKVGHFYRIELAGKIERAVCDKLVWITMDELENMYHESHQWIAATEIIKNL